ncbi:hypothetical protein IEQ34_014480 [Dendrobium chrysotoxum]|uniref:Uncharacterized protein n=1 Tax=Dendrobium chrysotoxum TaxID=161865 RepID=A0AAV7GM51_DENCH|nr:hypothetical protein IEQ34_014480 [Dendrobium chrysotoxum]
MKAKGNNNRRGCFSSQTDHAKAVSPAVNESSFTACWFSFANFSGGIETFHLFNFPHAAGSGFSSNIKQGE